MHTEEKTINRMLGLDQLNQNAPMYKRWTKYCLQWVYTKGKQKQDRILFSVNYYSIVSVVERSIY